MSEGLEKPKQETGEETMVSLEELAEAIRESEDELGDQSMELNDNIGSIDMATLSAENRENIWEAFRQAKEQIETTASTAMIGGNVLIVLSMIQGVDKSEDARMVAESLASGGVATSLIGAVILGIGHMINNLNRDRKLSDV